MKKTEDTIKWKLKVAYDTACNGYRDALLSLWELDWHYGYWNSDEPGTIYHYGEVHNLTMEEIIYIVDNDIEEAEVIVWEDYMLDAIEFGFDVPNLMAWHRGCPRIPNATFDRLRQMKTDLEKLVDDEKERLKKKTE
jgi:hypothetical protein